LFRFAVKYRSIYNHYLIIVKVFSKNSELFIRKEATIKFHSILYNYERQQTIICWECFGEGREVREFVPIPYEDKWSIFWTKHILRLVHNSTLDAFCRRMQYKYSHFCLFPHDNEPETKKSKERECVRKRELMNNIWKKDVSLHFVSHRFNSIQFNSIQFNSIQLEVTLKSKPTKTLFPFLSCESIHSVARRMFSLLIIWTAPSISKNNKRTNKWI
jgi:hypothetical protein